MLVDLRLYTYHHHKFYEFLSLYKQEGFPLTTKHLGTTMSIGTAASGTANQTFQFFCYDDQDHRDTCRLGLRTDTEWLAYVKKAAPSLANQHNTLMVSTPKSPIQAPAEISKLWLNRAGEAPENEVLELCEICCKPGTLGNVMSFFDDEFASFIGGFTNRPVLRFFTQSDQLDRIMLLSSFERLQKTQELRQSEWADKEMSASLARISEMINSRSSRLISPLPYAN